MGHDCHTWRSLNWLGSNSGHVTRTRSRNGSLGASFGDKMSPVSDTTNLAAMSANTDLYSHIKSMMYSTVPTYLICVLIFTVIGFYFTTSAISDQEMFSTP